MNITLCQGLNCNRKERCLRFQLIETKTKEMVIGLPWMAHKMCRPGWIEKEEDYKEYIEIVPVAQLDRAREF